MPNNFLTYKKNVPENLCYLRDLKTQTWAILRKKKHISLWHSYVFLTFNFDFLKRKKILNKKHEHHSSVMNLKALHISLIQTPFGVEIFAISSTICKSKVIISPKDICLITCALKILSFPFFFKFHIFIHPPIHPSIHSFNK